MADIDLILDRIAEIKQLTTQLYDRPIAPRDVHVVNGLSEISDSLGLVKAGELRSGNAVEPGKGFSGVRIGYPGFSYESEVWNIAGINNDTLQFGLRVNDGKALVGAGIGIMDEDGYHVFKDTSQPVYDTKATATTAGSQESSLDISITIGEHDNRCLIVGVGLEDSTVSTITWTPTGGSPQSMSLVQQDTASAGANTETTEIWELVAPVVGSGTITITPATSDYMIAEALSYYNVNQSNPTPDSAGDNDTTGAVSTLVVSVATTSVTDLVVGVCAVDIGGVTLASEFDSTGLIRQAYGDSRPDGAFFTIRGTTDPTSIATVTWTNPDTCAMSLVALRGIADNRLFNLINLDTGGLTIYSDVGTGSTYPNIEWKNDQEDIVSYIRASAESRDDASMTVNSGVLTLMAERDVRKLYFMMRPDATQAFTLTWLATGSAFFDILQADVDYDDVGAQKYFQVNPDREDIDFIASGENNDVFKVRADDDTIIMNSVKTSTGDYSGESGKLVINTVDNNIKMYADGAWRTLASW